MATSPACPKVYPNPYLFARLRGLQNGASKYNRLLAECVGQAATGFHLSFDVGQRLGYGGVAVSLATMSKACSLTGRLTLHHGG